MKEFETLFQGYLSMFYKDGEPALRAVINCVVPSKIVLSRYRLCQPIESLTEDKKRDLWNFARGMYPEETSKEELTRVAKIIHTIGTFL